MEISKLTFFEETKRQLSNPFINKNKRSQLKGELVKEYIRNKPNGHRISVVELMKVATYDPKKHGGYKSGWGFINGMVVRKEITRETIPNSSKAIWSIPGDAKTIVSASPIEFNTDKYDTSRSFAKKTKESKTDKISFDDENVAELAKEYYWQTSNDSLREFIKWVEERNSNA